VRAWEGRKLQGTSTIDLLLAYYGDDFTGSTDVPKRLRAEGDGAIFDR
jgi:hypothetical protein